MSDSIERTDLEEVEIPEVKQQRKKRVLTEAQKEAVAKNLEKGRLKLQEKNLAKQAKRGEELQEKVLKKEVSSVKSKSAEDKRIDLALQALDLVRNKTDNIHSENDDEPKPTPRKKQVKKVQEDTETEVEEVIVKSRPKKKKTIVYMDNETETETDIEPMKQKRSYRKRAEQRKTEIETSPTPIHTPQPQIIFY